MGKLDSDTSALEQELEAIAGELRALPLINENKQQRLALNQRLLAGQAELAAKQRAQKSELLRAERARVTAELAALADVPEERARRPALKRRLAEIADELASLDV